MSKLIVNVLNLAALLTLASLCVARDAALSAPLSDTTVVHTITRRGGTLADAQIKVAFQVGDDRSSDARSCVTDATEPTPPSTTADIENLVLTYQSRCPSKLSSALESIFSKEQRSDAWATRLEEKIKDLVPQVEGLTVSGECRTSLCRYDFQFRPESKPKALILEFDYRLIAALKDTPYRVSSVINYPGPSAYRKFILGGAIPSAFVEPLRLRMGER